jgi:hypothetical protein
VSKVLSAKWLLFKYKGFQQSRSFDVAKEIAAGQFPARNRVIAEKLRGAKAEAVSFLISLLRAWIPPESFISLSNDQANGTVFLTPLKKGDFG